VKDNILVLIPNLKSRKGLFRVVSPGVVYANQDPDPKYTQKQQKLT
jgi:hypothetical protein